MVRFSLNLQAEEATRACGLGSVCGTETILEGIGRVDRFRARGPELSYLQQQKQVLSFDSAEERFAQDDGVV